MCIYMCIYVYIVCVLVCSYYNSEMSLLGSYYVELLLTSWELFCLFSEIEATEDCPKRSVVR